MQVHDLNSMSVDELWEFHERLTAALGRRLTEEKKKLEERLNLLKATNAAVGKQRPRVRRPYPKVYPKYRNPRNPAETWAGRGKQPRWFRAQLRSGKKPDDLLIERQQ